MLASSRAVEHVEVEDGRRDWDAPPYEISSVGDGCLNSPGAGTGRWNEPSNIMASKAEDNRSEAHGRRP
jgi:hypothetical protein